jgi:hypothetical protein
MYFVDENGMTVIIPFGGKIKKDKWLVKNIIFRPLNLPKKK